MIKQSIAFKALKELITEIHKALITVLALLVALSAIWVFGGKI